MKITRRYRFYAAHRNQYLNDKCSRLHGHRYGVEVTLQFATASQGTGVAMLFGHIDNLLSPVFEALDHRTLLHMLDPLVGALPASHTVVLEFPTSAENLAAWLLQECVRRESRCVELALTETDSGTVTVGLEDLATWTTQ